MGLLLAIHHLKNNASHFHVYLPLILKSCKDVENLLQFIYVNETFFKAKCSMFSFYIAACDKSSNENNPFSTFSHFLRPVLNYLPYRSKRNLGPPLFIICIQTSAFNICKK